MKKLFTLLLMMLLPLMASADAVEIDGIYYNLDNEAKTAEVASNPNKYSGAVVIPESVTYEEVAYSVTSIGDWALAGNRDMTSVSIPNSVITIGDYAFNNSSGLTSITIPNSVTTIGASAFSGCAGLTSMNVPSSVTTIGEQAFSDCHNLTSITVDKENKRYDSRDNCNAIIETVTNTLTHGIQTTIIPNSVETIGNYAFSVNSITELEIPEGVKSIETYAFDFCVYLRSIIIPKSVTKIGRCAFKNCWSLKDVQILGHIEEMGDGAFNETCVYISVMDENPSDLSEIAFNDVNRTELKEMTGYGGKDWFYSNSALFVPKGTLEKYQSTAGWKEFKNMEEGNAKNYFSAVNNEGVTIYYKIIDDTELMVTYCGNSYDYRPNEYSGDVIIPESVEHDGHTYPVTTIGKEAFRDCAQLTSVTIPNSVTSIDEGAFRDCSSLTSVTIPNSVISIGYVVFQCCSSLTSITIPNSVASIGPWAFDSTPWYDNQPNGIIYAGKVLYGYKGKIPEGTSLNVEEGTLGITNFAFQKCDGITSLTIPNSVTSIGQFSFEGCTGLTSVTIQSAMTSIGFYAFHDCSSLTDFYCYAIDVPATDVDAFSSSDVSNATLHVPAGSIDAYKAAEPWSQFKEIVALEEEDETAEDIIKISGVGQTTWCSAYDLDFTDVEGLKAYTATGYNRTSGTIWLSRVKEVPANEGILLIGDPGDYQVPHKNTTCYYANLMVGTVEAITINETEGEYTNYYLSNGASGVGFYKVNGSVDLKANRAYLPLLKNTVSGSRGFIGLEFDEDAEGTTGISNNNREPITNNIWYNLQGQRVDNPSKGLYIKNGKKVLIK